MGEAMKEWVPANADGTAWSYGDSLLYRSTCDGGWAGSLRGYSVVYDKAMAVAARRLMAMEDDPLIN